MWIQLQRTNDIEKGKTTHVPPAIACVYGANDVVYSVVGDGSKADRVKFMARDANDVVMM